MKNLYGIENRLEDVIKELEEAKNENIKEEINNSTEVLFNYMNNGETSKRDIELILSNLIYKIKDIEKYGNR